MLSFEELLFTQVSDELKSDILIDLNSILRLLMLLLNWFSEWFNKRVLWIALISANLSLVLKKCSITKEVEVVILRYQFNFKWRDTHSLLSPHLQRALILLVRLFLHNSLRNYKPSLFWVAWTSLCISLCASVFVFI